MRPPAPSSEPRAPGFEVFRGIGYGHLIPGVNLKDVVVLASTGQGLAYYCDLTSLKTDVEFEIVEVMKFDDGRLAEFVIRRAAGRWNYALRDGSGETLTSTDLCVACHERGADDPLFRAPQSCPWKHNGDTPQIGADQDRRTFGGWAQR